MTTAEWRVFLEELRSERVRGSNGAIVVFRDPETGDIIFRSKRNGTELRFDDGEYRAFIGGVRNGEFDPDPT